MRNPCGARFPPLTKSKHLFSLANTGQGITCCTILGLKKLRVYLDLGVNKMCLFLGFLHYVTLRYLTKR